MIEYLPAHQLRYKYLNEIHCNEVAILPYYIANLNIEYTYQQKMGEYLEFENICFMDTLDHTTYQGKQMDLFAMTLENTERIQRQNDREISVIIGNPPYNAWQDSFNDNNANRVYQSIDQRIRETYVKQGQAQNQIAVYDMYTRFIRWATDRVKQNGIISFVTNSSFIDGLTFDGFRQVLAQEFSDLYIIDLGGNVRKNPKLSGTTHNVFGIQAGVALSFLVKKQDNARGDFKIFYLRRPEMETAEEKLSFLAAQKFDQLELQHIQPDKKHNWINLTDNDFDELLPLVDKEVKAGRSQEAVFQLFSRGVVTQRDEWVYDFSDKSLADKMRFFVDIYQRTLADADHPERNQIKWDAELTRYRERGIIKEFDPSSIVPSLYRPYTKQYLYFDRHFNGRTYQIPRLFPSVNAVNQVIAVTNHTQIPFLVQVTDCIPEVAVGGRTGQCLPLYRYDENGNRQENITDWALEQFQSHYRTSAKTITKLDIFHYTYAVLHNPNYRKKYELNLKRDFPRLPFYDDFFQWANWGQQLMHLHLNYETVEPYPLERVDIPLKETQTYQPKLKADKTKHEIILDNITTLKNIPPTAWDYKLGNRCALEWILDQYKEKKPRDATIREKFNTYRFIDYKETVVDLLLRVCRVSVETMKIIEEISAVKG